MAKFQDSMDQSRVVEPVTTKGNKMVCRVYNRGTKALEFVGNASIPSSLFGDGKSEFHKRVGFVPFA